MIEYRFYICMLVLLLMVMTSSVRAQHSRQQKPHKEPFKIEEIVSDLSSSQKRKLNTINEESQKTIEYLHQMQKQVHDSIHMFLIQVGNYSAQLNPLFEREGMLQATIAKEKYAIRLRIEEVLTEEQRQTVYQYFKNCKRKTEKQ